MNFRVPNAPEVKVLTESGIARRVYIDGNEIGRVTDVDIAYGINDLPLVKITFMAKVNVIEDKEECE